MPLKHPTLRYRPTRTPDGEGGFTETLGASVTIYGAIELHKNKTVLICEIHDDVDTGDVIVAEGGRYRVTQEIERVMMSRLKRVGIERMERPISI
jgi:hypothetical protein